MTCVRTEPIEVMRDSAILNMYDSSRSNTLLFPSIAVSLYYLFRMNMFQAILRAHRYAEYDMRASTCFLQQWRVMPQNTLVLDTTNTHKTDEACIRHVALDK